MSWFPIEGVLLPPEDSSSRPSKWRQTPDAHWKSTNPGNNKLSILKVFLSPLSAMQLLYLKLCHNSCLNYSPQLNRSNGVGGGISNFPISHVSFPGLRLTIRGSNLDRGKIFLSSPKWPDQLWGPPSLVFDMHWWLPAPSAKVKNEWSCTFTTIYANMHRLPFNFSIFPILPQYGSTPPSC
jgi:hypothetical protein